MPLNFSSLDDTEGTVTTFERNMSKIFQSMLRTAYDYAAMAPDKVHVYFQIERERAGIDCLFEIAGEVLEVHTLNNSKLEQQFDTTEYRQQQLMQFLATGLKEFIELFANDKRDLPTEVWLSINIENEEKETTLSYRYLGGHINNVEQNIQAWKLRLQDPSYAKLKAITFLDPKLAEVS